MKFKLKNNKKKMRPLTKQESILITISILCAIGYFSYTLLIKPVYTRYLSSKEELEQVMNTYESIERDYKNLKKFKEKQETTQYQMEELLKQLPPYISQEDIILTIGKIAKNNNINVSAVALENENASGVNNFVASNNKNEDATAKEQAPSKDNNAEGKKTENGSTQNNQKSSAAGPMVMTKYITLSFSGKVTHLYNFIDEFEKNDKKIAFKEISLNKDKSNILSGNMKFQYVAYKDKNSSDETYELEVPETTGKTTPFDTYPGYVSIEEEKNNSISEGNFCIGLNKMDSKTPKFIFGEMGKTETEIYNNSNEKISGKFVIEKGKGTDNFKYTYSLGNNSKTETKNIVVSNGKLIIIVKSNPRDSKEDIMQLNLDVENNTDIPVEVRIVNDDTQNPRFALNNKKGNVYSKQVSR